MPLLRIQNGPTKGQIFEIGDENLLAGRDPACQVQILDKGVSRKHAEFFHVGELYFIRDLESRNGIFVNQNKVDEELLRDGDTIQIGATILQFETDNELYLGNGLEFSGENEDNFSKTLTLRLEDLTTLGVSESTDTDGSEGRRLRSLYGLSRILSEDLYEEDFITKVLGFCARQIEADGAYLFVPDPKKGTIKPLGTYSTGEAKTNKISRSIIRKSLQERRALLTSDAMQDKRFSAHDSIVLKQIHSVICAPLSATGDVGGVVYFSSSQIQQVFDEQDLELVAAMAEMIGLGILSIESQRQLRENFLSAIKVLLRASEVIAPEARNHSERLALYARSIGTELHLPEDQRNNLRLAALLHDIGKLTVGIHNAEDHDDDHQHHGTEEDGKLLQATLKIIDDMSCAPLIRDSIRYMCERLDGSGPEGLSGDDIPLGARILAVCSEFDRRMGGGDAVEDKVLARDILDDMQDDCEEFDCEILAALEAALEHNTIRKLRDGK